MSADLLGAIVAATRRIVAVREQRQPVAALRERVVRPGAGRPRIDRPGAARPAGERRGRFLRAIGARDRLNVIAECTRRSPSRGVLRAASDPAAIACGLAAAPAACIRR
jgi:indole-3-glycerol phosphate synthase